MKTPPSNSRRLHTDSARTPAVSAKGSQSRSPKQNAQGETQSQPAQRGRGELVLVEQDQLFFRIVQPASMRTTSSASDQHTARSQVIEQEFRRDFSEVWQRIHATDRQILLAYWRAPLLHSSCRDPRAAASSQPMIRVVADGPRTSTFPFCERPGNEIGFTVDEQSPAALIDDIARALAQVHRFATRAHWNLIQEMIEEPLARWEKSRIRKVTDAERDKKLDLLELAHRRACEGEIAELLRRWGFSAPHPETRHPGS